MRSLTSRNSVLLPVITAGVAVLALIWFLAISPKRSDSSTVGVQISAQQERLDAARTQVASFSASRKRFQGLLAELRRIDVAVPARGEISTLLRELQQRARLRDSDLRLAKLKIGAAPVEGTQPVTPGAAAGSDGLSVLPFTFSYTGRYFDLIEILRAVRRSVTVRSGDLAIDGRLLTIDGLTFDRPEPGSRLTKAVINATAYIAATPAPAKPAAAPEAVAAPAPAKAGP